MGSKKSLYSGLALGQIGEFAFIITSIGVAGGIVGPRFQAIIVSVAVLSSLCTPLLWQRADKIIAKLLEWMPNRMRIAIGLYEAWFDRLREGSDVERLRFFGVPKKILIPFCIDIFLLVIIPPAILEFLPDFLEALGSSRVSVFKDIGIPVIFTLIVGPVLYGFVKTTSQLVLFLANELFTDKEAQGSENEALKRLFSMMVWSIVIFLVGTLVLLVIRPYTNSTIVLISLAVMFVFTLTLLWRRASEVANDFKSGGQKLVTVLRRQTYQPREAPKPKKKMKIPGLENIEPVELTNKNLIGKPLSEISLRNISGLTVVSIYRGSEQIMFPNQEQLLESGDILQIWGNEESKKKCKNLLRDTNN